MKDVDHTDVGAFALGVLGDGDRQAFEEHLPQCPPCRAELHVLSPMAGLLKYIHPDTVMSTVSGTAGPVQQNGSMLHWAASRATAAGPRRPLLIRALCMGVIVAIAAFLGAVLLGGGEDPHLSHGWARELVLTGERFQAADQTTGIRGIVGVESKGWGTHVALQLEGIRGPLRCRLVAISRSGEAEAITNWAVPPHGYGVPGAAEPLYVHGGTSIARSTLSHFRVETTDGTHLLTVDAHGG